MKAEQLTIAIAELTSRAAWYRRRVKDNKREDIVLSAEQQERAEACEAAVDVLAREGKP